MGLFGDDNTILGTAAAIGVGYATGGWATAATMGLSAYSSLSAGDARAQNLEDQQALAMLSAEEALTRGASNSRMTLEKGARIASEQKVIYAGSGVDVNTGAPLEVANQTLYNAHRESNKILEEAQFAYNMRKRGAVAYGDQAARERTSSLLNAASGIGSSAYRTWSYTQAKNNYKTNADSSLLGEG